MQAFDVDLGESGQVGARIYQAAAPRAGVTLVLAHGAGAPHTSPFMLAFAEALAARGLDTATFNFPYMEARRRVPDRGPVLEACYAAVVGRLGARPELEGNRMVIGGKSMGGRIASQMVAHDRETSGLVAFAKSWDAKRKLQAQFEARTVERIYRALVEGTVRDAEGTLSGRLAEDRSLRVGPARRGREGREAITRYRVLERQRATTLLELSLVTGRRGQIRAQLAAAGATRRMVSW